MGSWAQGISWLKFASVCRLLSFRVKLYLKPRTRHRRDYLAQGTTNFYTKVRFATNILTLTLFDNVLQRSSVQVTLKLLEDYWKMKGHKYNQGLWNVCLVVRCWCWRVSVYNLVRAAVGDTSHAPATAQPSPLSPPEYMMGWSWAGVMTFIFLYLSDMSQFYNTAACYFPNEYICY